MIRTMCVHILCRQFCLNKGIDACYWAVNCLLLSIIVTIIIFQEMLQGLVIIMYAIVCLFFIYLLVISAAGAASVSVGWISGGGEWHGCESWLSGAAQVLQRHASCCTEEEGKLHHAGVNEVINAIVYFSPPIHQFSLLALSPISLPLLFPFFSPTRIFLSCFFCPLLFISFPPSLSCLSLFSPLAITLITSLSTSPSPLFFSSFCSFFPFSYSLQEGNRPWEVLQT